MVIRKNLDIKSLERINMRSENNYRVLTYQSVGRSTLYSDTFLLTDKYKTLVHETFTGFIVEFI